MTFDELSPELRDKAQACKTPEEMLELAKDEGIELSEADMEGISGGWGSSEPAYQWKQMETPWDPDQVPTVEAVPVDGTAEPLYPADGWTAVPQGWNS